MYQIAICDDEKFFIDKLAHTINQYSNAHHHVIDLNLFQQPADFIQSSLDSYDIVFLDVRFGEMSGIEVAKALRAKNENAILIFVSAFVEYAIMGYSVHASAYLLKSDLDGTFENCMDEIFQKIGVKEISVRVPYEHTNIDIPCKYIIYIESHKRQIQMHTSLPRYPSVLYYAKLSDMIETLEPHGFLRIHKSYLINLSRCRKIQNRLAYMDNSIELPCSRQNYTDIVQKFLRWKEREI
jgi:DNA-binding LytR/AlgR family response regulator